MISWPFKDPDERLDYVFDWSPRGLTGDTIETVTPVIISGTIDIEANEIESLTTRHWISGGAVGEKCEIKITITTAADRTLEDTVYISIQSR
jgi:hypothetical protein